MNEQHAFGDALGERLGLGRPPTVVCRALRRSPIAVIRLRSDAPCPGIMAPLPSDDAFVIALQLREVASRQLWVDGRRVSDAPYAAGVTTLYDLTRSLAVGIGSPFDCVQFHLPRTALDDIADDFGVRRARHLVFEHGVSHDDPVVRDLGSSVLPALRRPEQVNGLFVDHVALALRAHVAHAYGGMRRRPAAAVPQPARGGLAPWQERRAKALLDANLDGDLSLTDVARECGLSLSYFARAFKQSMGVPPHRWLLQRRVAKAKDLLLASPLPLSEVALACGFADQSHFGRVFGEAVGATPGAWRRWQGCAPEQEAEELPSQEWRRIGQDGRGDRSDPRGRWLQAAA